MESFVISKTPFRVSFFGGGSDYPYYYRDNPAAVIATSINRYCYIMARYLPPFFDHKHQISWSYLETVNDINDIRHPAVREVFKFLEVDRGVDIHHAGDLPARAGMGTSSAFTVGLLNAMYALKDIKPSPINLGLQAIHIEQDLIKEKVGSQDQITSAVGGFNRINFSFKNNEHDINVTPIKNGKKLEPYLMLFFTGLSRTASDIAKTQIDRGDKNIVALSRMYQMVGTAEYILECGNILEFGSLLDESWRLKKTLSPKVSTEYIDFLYAKALKAGAIGGKVTGAGGGGFLLLFVEPDKQQSVKNALDKLLYVPLKFDTRGSQIIYDGRLNSEI